MKILLWIWQLPQNLIGWIITRNIVTRELYKNITIYYKLGWEWLSAVSLGQYIILNTTYYYQRRRKEIIKHEYGHYLQSKCLGWFYLIVIGLPSLLGNIYDRIFHKNWNIEKREEWYYSQPWEKWADYLAEKNVI